MTHEQLVNHICNKDIVLLTYPAQYKCSICGKVDNSDFLPTLNNKV